MPRADAYLCQEEREQRTRQLCIKKLPQGGTTPRMYTPTLGPTFLVLHLFAGRRRGTDFHCKLTEMAHRLGLQVQILSLDVAVDQEYGNLDSRSKNWAMVARAVTNGWVAAAVAGSPCNTYSEARNHQPPEAEGQHWPRPLRTAVQPWGPPGLKPREMRHLILGSTFALQTLWIVANLLLQGAAMISEHPDVPTDPTRVSIWKVALTQLLLQHPSAVLHSVPQGLYGASAWKKTGLLAVNLPRLMTSMRKWRTQFHPGKEEMIGRSSDGQFKTAILKEYPEEFSAALAQGICDFLQATSHRDVQFQDPEWEAWYVKARATLAEVRNDGQMQPDLQV